MSKSISAIGSAIERVPVALTARADAGSMGSWQNTSGGDVMILSAHINCTTKSTAAARMNVGQAATAIESGNLIDGADVGTAAGLFSSTQNSGPLGAPSVIVANGHYVTFFCTAASTGFVGQGQLIISEL